MSSRWVVLFLSLLLGLQPVATDLYLPTLPALTLDLGASMSQAQLTLTAMLLAFGFSQLVWGPVSDRLGRRPVLILGMGLFALAALGSVWAQTMDGLIVWRVLQGVAMGAAVMGARAIVRDLYGPVDAARAMSSVILARIQYRRV
jgi:DHA1 family bicyclomycin/chloramphenicol resistance-like MFS transporter